MVIIYFPCTTLLVNLLASTYRRKVPAIIENRQLYDKRILTKKKHVIQGELFLMSVLFLAIYLSFFLLFLAI